MARRELLIGCGNNRAKAFYLDPGVEWADLVTLDNDPNCRADVEWDLERLPLPFGDDEFDEIHAYHVLEHTGRQGDYRFFFAQFSEFWRILKPNGCFCAVVPAPTSPWAWGDPGHTRLLPPEILTFLDQSAYTEQVGKTALADYRHVYRADFRAAHIEVREIDQALAFALLAVKPSRISK